MAGKVLLVAAMALLALAQPPASALEGRGIVFRPELGATEGFTVVHQTRYGRGDALVDGPGASYRLSITVMSRSANGYLARVTVGAVTRLPATVPGIDHDSALALGLDGLTFELALDEAGRPTAIEEWRELRLEMFGRLIRRLRNDPAGELVSFTTSRLIRSLDAASAARLLARPLALMAEVRDVPYEHSNLRVDLDLPARAGATMLPGPYDWSVSFEPLVTQVVGASWQARPTRGAAVTEGLEHRENGTAVYREDGWPTRLAWTATTLNEGDLVERSVTVTMIVGGR